MSGEKKQMKQAFNMSHLVFLLLGVMPLLTEPVTAQTPLKDTALTLPDAIQLAMTQNPEILSAHSQVESGDHKVVAARSGLWPEVNVAETFQNTNNPMWAFGTKLNQGEITQMDFDPDRLNDPDAINNYNTSLSLGWSIYDGGRTLAGLSQAKLNTKFTRLGLKKTKQDIISKTAQAYVGLLLADQNQKVIDKALTTAKVHQTMIKSRFSGGFVVKSDLLRAQVRIFELTQEQLQAESQVEIAKARLNAAMGNPMDTPLVLVTPFQICAETEENQAVWIERSLKHRPDLKQLVLQKEMALEQIKMNRAGHLPQVMLNGAYEVDTEDFDNTADSYTVGATVQLNLFAGKGVSAKVKAAKADLNKVSAMYTALARGVEVQTREAYLLTQSAWQRITVAKQSVTQSEEALRIVMNRYKGGLLTIVDLLDAQVADQQARTLHFKALHDYKVARIKLVAAAGVIGPDFQ
jgi:outer membrane protein